MSAADRALFDPLRQYLIPRHLLVTFVFAFASSSRLVPFILQLQHLMTAPRRHHNHMASPSESEAGGGTEPAQLASPSLITFQLEIDPAEVKRLATSWELGALKGFRFVELATLQVDSAPGTGVSLFPPPRAGRPWRADRTTPPSTAEGALQVSQATAKVMALQTFLEPLLLPFQIRLKAPKSDASHNCERHGHLPRPSSGSAETDLPRCAFSFPSGIVAELQRVPIDGQAEKFFIAPTHMASSLWSLADPASYTHCTLTINGLRLESTAAPPPLPLTIAYLMDSSFPESDAGSTGAESVQADGPAAAQTPARSAKFRRDLLAKLTPPACAATGVEGADKLVAAHNIDWRTGHALYDAVVESVFNDLTASALERMQAVCRPAFWAARKVEKGTLDKPLVNGTPLTRDAHQR